MLQVPRRRRFLMFLIKPSRYDESGYVVQWFRSALPSNSLACVNGLAAECAARKVLGHDVDIETIPIDETNTRVRPDRIIKQLREAGGFGMVGLVGVQSNQFPRAMDIARPLRAAGVQVCIGGFHVSGTIAMIPELTPELQEAIDLGVSLYAGEAEGRLEDLLQDAAKGSLQPIYNYMNDLPALDGAPMPLMPLDRVKKTIGMFSSFDAGRGCPFQCSFCTIINVQGRKSRYRTADDVEAIIRANHKMGIKYFLITDDNLARNKNWEAIFDRLAYLREVERISLKIVIQVDTLCHKIPNFIQKASRAGVKRVFIGLENINPANLVGAKKKQNRIADYREMLLEWRKVRCVTYCGFIIGFPSDTPESVIRDIEIIKKELPLDILEFSCLTPLPGSEDHQKAYKAGVPMDPDLNKYDIEHVCADHANMTREEWSALYQKAWETYYTKEHITTVIKRAAASGIRTDMISFLMCWFWASKKLENIYPLESGLFRRRARTDRRPGFPIENPWTFYPKLVGDLVYKLFGVAKIFAEMSFVERAIRKDPKKREYMDTALMPVTNEDVDNLELFQSSDSARAAGAKAKKLAAVA